MVPVRLSLTALSTWFICSVKLMGVKDACPLATSCWCALHMVVTNFFNAFCIWSKSLPESVIRAACVNGIPASRIARSIKSRTSILRAKFLSYCSVLVGRMSNIGDVICLN